jgi:hypothetical protein
MGLEKVIHRMATDVSFAKDMQMDPEATLKDANVSLGSDEFAALKSVLGKMRALDLSILGSAQLADWYRSQLADWYRGQLADWYLK